MLIEDVEAFKTWLGKTLQPICDADPLALAKYVVALVKKDKVEEELRTSCYDQLEVFLQDKTKGFVATLFEALKSKVYIQAANNSSPALPPSNSSGKSESRKSSRSEEGSEDHRRKRSHSRSPVRDRDRSRRSYDDRRRNDTDRGSRSHSRYDSDYRSRNRTRSRSRSPRSRSPRSRSPRRRSRSRDRSKHKSRSPDRIPVHMPSDSRGSTPVQDDTKDPPRGPVISSEVTVPPHSGYHGRERPPPRPRCRDYDEKGFCMRGDLCPFDHGVDPVVLDDVVTFNSGGPPPSGPRGPSPGPPGGPHGPPGGPPHGPPGGPHGPPGGPHGPPGPHGHPNQPRGPPVPPHSLPSGMHDHRGPPPPHHMPPVPQEPHGPRPLRPMLHHGPPPSRPPPPPQGPPPQQGPPPPRPPRPPHPGDPAQGNALQHGGVESTRLPTSQPPSAFRPLPPPSQQLPPQQGPPPPSTQSMRTEYEPEPYNPEAPMLRNKTNDFWHGNHGRGRGRGRGNHGHDRDGHGHDRSGHGNERDMDRDRMRHQFQPQHPRRDLVSIPTIPEPSEEELPTVVPQNNNGSREGGGISSRVVVPSKRKYEMSGEPDEDEDSMPFKQQHMMQPHPQHHPPHHPPQHHPPHHQQHHQLHQHHQGPPQQPPWANTGPGHKKPHFDFKRLGPQRRVHANSDNCTLELRRVPREHNNIAKLNEHFSKFGHIVNLQVCYEGDTEAALITFLTNAQAQSAYRSPEPVLNNRFIKVFWHKASTENPSEAEAGASNEPAKLSIKDRLGEIPPPHKLQLTNNKPTAQAPADGNSKKVVVSPLGLTKTVFNRTAMKKGPINTRLGSQQQHQEIKQQRQQEQQARQQLQAGLVQKKKQQEQEMMKKKMAIQKEKQLLLHKQINKQKLLIGKLESKGITAEQKTKIMKTIKTLADIIETLKTDLTTSTPKPKAAPVKAHVPRTKQEAQKEILDTELDIIAKQNEGADTSALRRRVAALKKEATVLGLLGHGGRGRGAAVRGSRGRGTTRGGRGGHPATLSVDRRPKQLHVVGFDPADKEPVVELLSKDGGVETVLHDDTAVTMVITYQTRLQAEQAIKRAAEYEKGELGLSWYKPGGGSGDSEAAAPISLQDEALLTEVTGQVLSRHNSLVGEVEDEESEEVVVSGTGTEEPVIEDEDDDDEDVLRVGEGEDEENMPGGIGDHELDDEMDEDLLLGVDEEEDDEEEGRSWRR